MGNQGVSGRGTRTCECNKKQAGETLTLTMVSRPMMFAWSHMLLPRLYSTLNTALPFSRKGTHA